MITHNDAARLVDRFRQNKGFDFLTEDSINELITAMATAQTVAQAEEATQWLLDNMDDRPTVKQIKAQLSQTSAYSTPNRDQGCPHCHGTGLRSVYLVPVEGETRPHGGKLKCNRLHCGACPPGECLGTPGRDYEWQCVDRAKADGRVIIESAEACPACAYGRARGMAYAEREAERVEKLEKRRKGE